MNESDAESNAKLTIFHVEKGYYLNMRLVMTCRHIINHKFNEF